MEQEGDYDNNRWWWSIQVDSISIELSAEKLEESRDGRRELSTSLIFTIRTFLSLFFEQELTEEQVNPVDNLLDRRNHPINLFSSWWKMDFTKRSSNHRNGNVYITNVHITILLSSFKIQFIRYDTFYEFYPSPTDGQPMTDRPKMSRKNTRYSLVIQKNGFHILPYR